jgi:hypothetical protein
VSVRIKLTHSALRLMKHHKRLRAIATVSAMSNGVTTTGQLKVTLQRRA